MIFSILRSLRYFALLASNTSLLTLHPYIDVAFAAPTLETRSVGPWSGKGNLVVHQGATTIGCITANGEWTVGGQCGVFSAAPQGSSATQLTTSAGQCGFDSTWKFICEVGNPNGPENWHVSLLSFLLCLGVVSGNL